MADISVIVPVYKAEAYLRRCVDSILAQSYQDLEVILVEDGSPDNCGKICREYAAKDPRVTALHQQNQGQAAARNRAVAIAKGEWLCFVDSDDEIHPRMLELLHRAAAESGAAISMCRMLKAETMPEDFLRPATGDYEVLAMDEDTLLDCFDRGEYPGWVACAKLIRRKIVEEKLFTVGRVYEDNEAVCHWILTAGKIAALGEELYYYRTNPQSTTKKTFSLKQLDYLWALEQIIRFYHQKGLRRLAGRFADLYVREAAGFYRRVRSELERPDIARGIRRSAWAMFRSGGISMTKEQFEILLDATHPNLIRLYWPLEGAARTLRGQGFRAVLKKVRKQLGKEERYDP